ncbi:HD family phosphohydrolase [Calderihabitans maritimus]|nr:HDIG domain-containing metalloprotein [Calderihabitans maritimus]
MILGTSFTNRKIDLKPGEPSPQDFRARQRIEYVSEVLTEQARREAEKKVQPVYKVDETVLENMEEQISTYFAKLKEVKSDSTISEEEERVKRLKETMKLDLSPEVYTSLLQLDQETLNILESEAKQILRTHMEGGVSQEALEFTQYKVFQDVENLNINAQLKELLRQMVGELDFRPNLVYDPVLTAEKRLQAREAVEPVKVTIQQGEKIVGEGEKLTPAQIEALQMLGVLRPKSPYKGFLGLASFILLTSGLVIIYLYKFHRDIYNNESHYVLLGLLLVIMVIIAKIVTAIKIWDTSEYSGLVGYLIPTATGSMLISILLDSGLAIFSTIIMSFYVAIVTGNQWQFAAVSLIGGLVGVYSVSKLSQRRDLATASLYIILANVAAILAIGFMRHDSLPAIAIGSFMGVANGILSSVLTIGSLPFLETAFGITTAVKLLELSNPNQPLLKRLLMEAPGTYHHSIVVGNLAEAAADAVGADSLLARVGAYYHDIGKIKRPYFFIENQLTPENPHDKLSPSLSTLIITAHVKEGLELAKEEKLPKVIMDIILQHHGTSLCSYFYHKALEKDKDGTSFSEDDFRYDNPKPQTKEAAIVMLADSVEAGVRSMQKPTPGRMEGLVRKIIKEKLDDGQLEESDLTFRELNLIAQAFVRILNGIFHSRIEYPETVLKELERRKAVDAVGRKQSTG